MVSVVTVVTPHVLTVCRGKYIDFQSKLLCGKGGRILGGGGGGGKVSWETCCGNQVSVSAVVLTSFRGQNIDFQLKLLYGKP